MNVIRCIKLIMLSLLPLFIYLSCGFGDSYPSGDSLLDPYEQTQALGKGVNFGNLLEATPEESSWSRYGIVIEESHFDIAKDAGFDSVRIPISFSGHALEKSPYTIDEEFMQRIDQVVNWGLDKGLRIIIDMHHYNEIQSDPNGHRDRFIAMWKQIASRYKDYPDELYYEILNEPNDKLAGGTWNHILYSCLKAIRNIDNHHTVIAGCSDWSNPEGLSSLQLPLKETNTIVTFHFYYPHLFTFQGQDWQGDDFSTTGITWPGPPAAPVTPDPKVSQWVIDWINSYNNPDQFEDPDLYPGGEGIIRAQIAQAVAWGKEHDRPLWMGEFTVQDGADMTSRANWLRFVRQELEENQIPWSFFSLLSAAETYLYDIDDDSDSDDYDPWIIELTDALGLSVSN